MGANVMFGRGGAPVEEQVRFLEGEIGKVHIELTALHKQREEAIGAEVRAMALIDSAHAVKHRCDQQIEQRLEAISSLRAEISDLIPNQRGPVD
jgi:hypothetical protein